MTDTRHGIVFDFDGVLADSEPLHLRAYQEVLTPLGIQLTPDDYYANLLGFDDVGVFRAVGERAGLRFDDRQIAALIDDKSRVFDEVIATTDVLYPGAPDCVERMASAYPLGVASGALKGEILAVLRRARLDGYFRFIVSAEDTVRSKPAPDPYLRAASLHGLPPASCIAIEDSRWGLESAKYAGFRSVGITHTYPEGELAAADVVIGSLSEFTSELAAKLFSAKW
jgi:beta-phosphoglucomutase-like phosphatase (HAD superfamily)